VRVENYLLGLSLDIPLEYMTLLLCRDVYHCLPSELRTEFKENPVDVYRHITCLGAEGSARAQEVKSANRKQAG